MSLLSIILVTVGLCLFEVVSSVDNAIVNATILEKMNQRSRKLFLIWGVLFAVFIIRGLLPWLIVFLVNPQVGIWGSFVATFNGDQKTYESIQAASPRLLLGGGMFLLLLFLHWLFLEKKESLFRYEAFLQSQGVWYYAIVSIVLSIVVWLSVHTDPLLGFSAVVGTTAYFIVHGFRAQAERDENKLGTRSTELSQLFYLILIDATFSIDGVLGAFAFTLSVPLILLGNGAGALIISWLTVKNVTTIKKYLYLESGALYSIGFLSILMIIEGFGMHLPEWISPVITIAIVGASFYYSHKKLHQGA